ncbi:hypothetical protein FH968_13310 [Buttiauxella sp. B2]|uniref:hypothetical protein n=1 Tax=Buttiauxella sp. B2 TaxID=2587812 RepID=UPI001123583B|nr:hypothetical protein [Buttiauxella sp. B2]TNV19820.1 hypothetical protein FH968_13310 [Buttiauxella sp. B2]
MKIMLKSLDENDRYVVITLNHKKSIFGRRKLKSISVFLSDPPTSLVEYAFRGAVIINDNEFDLVFHHDDIVTFSLFNRETMKHVSTNPVSKVNDEQYHKRVLQ